MIVERTASVNVTRKLEDGYGTSRSSEGVVEGGGGLERHDPRAC